MMLVGSCLRRGWDGLSGGCSSISPQGPSGRAPRRRCGMPTACDHASCLHGSLWFRARKQSSSSVMHTLPSVGPGYFRAYSCSTRVTRK